MTPVSRTSIALLGTAALWGFAGGASAQERDLFEEAPWTLTLGGVYLDFEGDEEVEDGFGAMLKLGYDLNPRLALEGLVHYYPNLGANELEPGRFQLEDDIWGARVGLDLLFHLRNTKNLRFDPYLAAGPALLIWEESLGSGDTELILSGGGGLSYHFNDEWAVNSDVRTEIVGEETEFKLLVTAGVNWRWGARIPVKYGVSGGDIDSDGDGLVDSREAQIGTDPYNPDTDGDGLGDGQEVDLHHTDPLNPDSDLDALKDGAEVLTYKTNPLDRDTDKGGVADGHEVIEDNTNPLDPADDLQLHTLNIEFDYDKADLRPQYHDQIDVIVKVLQRDPGATARIEGHADKRKTSSPVYNQKLSERRAQAVLNYIATAGGIDRSRLTAAGYGFDRPVAPNDTEANMQKNRRTEIYIRPSGSPEAKKATP